jgi:hypothetical protein
MDHQKHNVEALMSWTLVAETVVDQVIIATDKMVLELKEATHWV